MSIRGMLTFLRAMILETFMVFYCDLERYRILQAYRYTIVALYSGVIQVSLFIFYHIKEWWLEILINIILMTMESLAKHLL
jgi:hypothetical protein